MKNSCILVLVADQSHYCMPVILLKSQKKSNLSAKGLYVWMKMLVS